MRAMVWTWFQSKSRRGCSQSGKLSVRTSAVRQSKRLPTIENFPATTKISSASKVPKEVIHSVVGLPALKGPPVSPGGYPVRWAIVQMFPLSLFSWRWRYFVHLSRRR